VLALPPWRPVVDGAVADDATAAIVRLAEPLRELEPEIPTLNQGAASLAILFGYLAEAGLVSDAGDVAWTHLARARRGIADRALPPELYGGFVGIAWACEHIDGHLVGERPDVDELTAIDDAVIAVLARANIFDLIAGTAGLAVYALERARSSRRRSMLELVADSLAPIAARGWWTPREWLSDPDAPADGWLDLGVAHGLPGVVAVLGELAGRGVAAGLYRDAVDALLARQQAGVSAFPATVRRDREPSPSRLAWCYGDPGIAAALCTAAIATDDRELLERARAIAARAAQRDPEASGVVDVGLCHGSIGLALCFQLVAVATDDAACAEAARFWVCDALARLAADGGAVIRARRTADGSWERVPSSGLLNGAVGLGLGLLAATTAIAPAWARVFLSFPAAP
jgi:lantibiotic modifying enzyme